MIDVKLCRDGVTRFVCLIGPWAFKLPRFGYGWKMGLYGLLGNMQERDFSTLRNPHLARVLWCAWGGWILVMERCVPVQDVDWRRIQRLGRWEPFTGLPVETKKKSSFGWSGNRLVAVDYGNLS